MEISKADISVPALSPTAPNVQRRVFALTSEATTAEIQQAIDDAAKLRGQKPVVYLAGGAAIRSTNLTHSGQCRSAASRRWHREHVVVGRRDQWDDAACRRPDTRGAYRDFSITGIWNKHGTPLERGIEFINVDQPGGLIWLDQASAAIVSAKGWSFKGWRRRASRPSVAVRAAPAMALGWWWTALGKHPSASSAVPDRTTSRPILCATAAIWWSGIPGTKPQWGTKGSEPRYIHLTDRGQLTFFGGVIATLPGPEPGGICRLLSSMASIGNLALICASFNTMNPQVRLAGTGQNMAFLALGVDFAETEPRLDVQAKDAFVATLSCRQGPAEKGTHKPLPDTGNPDPARLRQLLAPAREVLPTDWQPAPEGATDLRIHRVMVRYKVGEGMIFSGGQTRTSNPGP